MSRSDRQRLSRPCGHGSDAPGRRISRGALEAGGGGGLSRLPTEPPRGRHRHAQPGDGRAGADHAAARRAPHGAGAPESPPPGDDALGRRGAGRRHDADDPAGIVEGQVEVAVGALRHVAHARPAEQDLLVRHAVPVQGDAHELPAHEAGGEQVVPPARESVGRVEGDAAGADRRRPLQHRLLHARRLGLVAHRSAVVVDAERDGGPAVVQALPDVVQLVPAPRSVFGGEKLSGHGVPGHSLHVPVAVAPDGGPRARLPHERVVLRDLAVVAYAMHLAMGVGQTLRVVLVPAVAEREEQVPLPVEEEAQAEVGVVVPVQLFRSTEKRLLVDPAGALDAATDDHGVGGARHVPRLGVAQVDPTGLRVVRVKGEVHEAAVLFHPGLRQPLDILGGLRAQGDDAQVSFALGEDQASVGQELQAPGRVQAVHHRLEQEGLALAFEDTADLHAWSRLRQEPRRPGRLADEHHERGNLALGERPLEGRHPGAGVPVADARRQAGVVPAKAPGFVDQAGRPVPRQVGAVAARAERLVLVGHRALADHVGHGGLLGPSPLLEKSRGEDRHARERQSIAKEGSLHGF